MSRTEEQLQRLQENLERNGYKRASQYIDAMASQYGVHVAIAYELFMLLGPDEAFDGFLSALEDASC